MGITGLLPALKSIHRTKHLSEFKGQTIAVDAYVWLHKGVYSCATELATGKPSHKYVDYAMHRVRLLRHFGIEPYIVFDGGPLPAKRGTELERKQRREESLARGNALAAQGKHAQARDCYVKCVDVTPQMAYQFIKALRAENVEYVVAPYEADAQMAYLERIGLVNAILTEDSDLLVFGCTNVLFKFDPVANTVCHISRRDFGSVTSTASDTSLINLHGWNDAQFRVMAILSGCDYLPSITGIGLKTANNLLRKWKTAEGVVRAVMLEGKKNVPNGYLKQFNLAESCFLFQRVYDPVEEKLVHLTAVEGQLDEETDAYVGENLQPELAKRIAMGDADPVTHQPMKDVNPGFKPRALKPLHGASNSPNRKDKGKGRTSGGGILSFFGPNPIIPRDKPAPAKPTMTGALSGKRTLGEVMDQDFAKRKQRCSPHTHPVQSKFFTTSTPDRATPKRYSEDPIAGPSRIHSGGDNKENVYAIDDNDEVVSTISLKPNVSPTQDLDFDFEDLQDGVEQEDGYISPLSKYSQETQDLSSPVRYMFSPLKKKKRRSSARRGEEDVDDIEAENGQESVRFRGESRRGEGDEFDVDPVSSPVEFTKRGNSHSPRPNRSYGGLRLQTPARSFSMENILVADTPVRDPGSQEAEDVFTTLGEVVPPVFNGPDLQSCLDGEDGRGSMSGSEEGEEWNSTKQRLMKPAAGGQVHAAFGAVANNNKSTTCGSSGVLRMASGSGSVSSQSPSPQTPLDGGSSLITFTSIVNGCAGASNMQERIVIDVDALDTPMALAIEDPEEDAERMRAERVKSVAQGWRMKWALSQIQRDSSSSSSASTPAPISVEENQKTKKRKQGQSASVTKLRRSETNITPLGKHSLTRSNRLQQQPQNQQLAWSVPHKPKPKFKDFPISDSGGKTPGAGTGQQLLEKRSSLVFFPEVMPVATGIGGRPAAKAKKVPKPKFRDQMAEPVEDDWLSDVEQTMDAPSDQTWTRLNQFRFQ